MKSILFITLLFISGSIIAQLESPKLSPLAKLEQTIGLTQVKIEYSRPSLRGRKAFGEVVPLDEVWRTGANKNTTIYFSDDVLIGGKTLKKGTYSLYTKPSENNWAVYFYTTTDNWGTPDEWKEENIALEVNTEVKNNQPVKETFTMDFENITTESATLGFAWDKVKVELSIEVPTNEKMDASIKNVMNGPSPNDYYAAASFYLEEKKELDKALVWIDEAIVGRGDKSTFWMYHLKSKIQAEMKDIKGAIKTAEISLAKSKEAEHAGYIKRNEELLLELKKK